MNHESKYDASRQLEAAEHLAKLWAGLLPDHPVPHISQFLQWYGMSSEPVVVSALNRAARKALREGFDADRIGRYITGIIRHERDAALSTTR